MKSSRLDIHAVCFAAAIILGSIAVGMRLTVPEEIADYVSNGLLLPAYTYSLLFPLIACGFVLAGERPSVLVSSLAVLVSTLWFALQQMETMIFSDKQLALLILGYPVLATTMGLTAGSALLLPLRTRRWLVPVVCASCGLGLGHSIVLESPGDYHSSWFSSAGALGGMIVVFTSIALAGAVERIGAGSWLVVASRILGSWLIAASLMLAAIAFLSKPSSETLPMPTTSPDGIELPRQ